MNNPKDFLRSTTPEESARLMEQFDPQSRMEEDTLDRISARLSRKLPHKRRTRFFQRAWKPALAAAAACAAAYLVLGLTVPGVADSLYRLAHPDTTAESYLGELPEHRDPIAEIDQAIDQSNARNDSGCVELLGSYSGALDSDAYYNKLADSTSAEHIKEKLPSFDAGEYEYLRSLKPEIEEVYYDGTHLIMNTYFACPYAGDFLYGFGRFSLPHTHSLDMVTFEAVCETDGTVRSFGGFGSGIVPSDRVQEDGFRMQTDIDLKEPLPDGEARITLYYYIYNEDEIATAGRSYNVARVIHTFSFDTTPGNRSRTNTLYAALSGDAVFTVRRGGGSTDNFETIENRTVSLDGLTLSLGVSYLPGSAVIDINAVSYPSTFDSEMQLALFAGPDSGLLFDVYVNGERLAVAPSGTPGGNRMRLELPIHADDYDTLRSITLVPKAVCVEQFAPYLDPADGSRTGTPVTLETDAAPIAYPTYDFSITETAETVLTGCTIELPLPTE